MNLNSYLVKIGSRYVAADYTITDAQRDALRVDGNLVDLIRAHFNPLFVLGDDDPNQARFVRLRPRGSSAVVPSSSPAGVVWIIKDENDDYYSGSDDSFSTAQSDATRYTTQSAAQIVADRMWACRVVRLRLRADDSIAPPIAPQPTTNDRPHAYVIKHDDEYYTDDPYDLFSARQRDAMRFMDRSAAETTIRYSCPSDVRDSLRVVRVNLRQQSIDSLSPIDPRD